MQSTIVVVVVVVVFVVLDVDVVDDGGGVVVLVDDIPRQSQAKVTGWPTALFKQRSASVAVVLASPLGSQMHAG